MKLVGVPLTVTVRLFSENVCGNGVLVNECDLAGLAVIEKACLCPWKFSLRGFHSSHSTGGRLPLFHVLQIYSAESVSRTAPMTHSPPPPQSYQQLRLNIPSPSTPTTSHNYLRVCNLNSCEENRDQWYQLCDFKIP